MHRGLLRELYSQEIEIGGFTAIFRRKPKKIEEAAD
jgi:hypothetical protein